MYALLSFNQLATVPSSSPLTGGNVSAVVYVVVPVILQRKLGLLVLGVNHQSRSVTVKTVNYVSLTVLSGLVEVINIQYYLYVERRMSGSHTEDAHVLFNHDDVAVFINNLDVSALKTSWFFLVLLTLTSSTPGFRA